MGLANSVDAMTSFTASTALSADRQPIVKEDILPGILPHGSMFVLHNVLSPQECRHYIDWGKHNGYEKVDTGNRLCTRLLCFSCHYTSCRSCALLYLNNATWLPRLSSATELIMSACSYRNMQDAPRLAQEIFDRIKSFLHGDYLLHLSGEASVGGVKQQGVPDGMRPGIWQPTGINPRFRLVRYEGGGMFQPHFDYGFQPNAIQSTIQTFMLYLDAPKGADTVVYTEDQSHYSEPDCDNILSRIVPQPGMALVFNPWITHGGDPVQKGDEKHILRTEVMYDWEDSN